MNQHNRKRPSLSLVISLIALVVAMGGTSYAAVKIGTNDIQGGAVTSGKIKNETIRSIDVRNGGLRAQDFGGRLPAGPAGPQGPRGLPGVNRWALIGTDGTITAQSGGFTLVAGYPVSPVTPADPNGMRANGNVYLNANEDLADNAIVATIVLQNTVDVDGGGMAGRTAGSDANAEFSGEIAVSRCNVGDPAVAPAPQTGPTNCAPPGARNATSFVVSPRLSDGSVTTGPNTVPAAPNNRKAFYVILTGDSSDFVPAP